MYIPSAASELRTVPQPVTTILTVKESRGLAWVDQLSLQYRPSQWDMQYVAAEGKCCR